MGLNSISNLAGKGDRPGTPRILVADEKPDRRRWLCAALKSFGGTVRATNSGRRVLQLLLLDGSFDLIVATIGLPEPSGVTLIAVARSLGVMTPFVLVSTVFGDEALRSTVGEMGDAVLVDQPLDEGQLCALVDQILAEGVPLGELQQKAETQEARARDDFARRAGRVG